MAHGRWRSPCRTNKAVVPIPRTPVLRAFDYSISTAHNARADARIWAKGNGEGAPPLERRGAPACSAGSEVRCAFQLGLALPRSPRPPGLLVVPAALGV